MAESMVVVSYEAFVVPVESRTNRFGLVGMWLVGVAAVAGAFAVAASLLALVSGFTGVAVGLAFWDWQRLLWLAAGVAFVFAVVGVLLGHAALSEEAREVGGHEIGFSVLVFGYGVLVTLVLVLMAVPLLLLLF